MKQLVVATKNKKKLSEIKDILKGMGLKLFSLDNYKDVPRVVENGKTFQENAIKKAVKLARFTGEFCLGEDSGLCVDALGGAPGIYSARFSGRDKSDIKNNLKLLRLLKSFPAPRRKAHYVCAVALADKHGLVAVVEGNCSGLIAFKQAGSAGFGYDPLFYIPKYKKTFAQLGEKVKHKMSHRYYALKKAKRIIEKYIEKQKKS
ncbi:MAG TPA: RdgB/HAM1 family non-canonical purine NTP pyrophosphatase [Candidatus Omnitrophota bacterium]|nr:RdgB/HAM1 family non-canonical purine NTP pyrophosphatase [Candidatus Omnitrophota bacterium]HPT39538.1 RdgB/HAM1 family non-canonical purine NTP pyrophosphatase [Candidatus Omnitrophota bacterium]